MSDEKPLHDWWVPFHGRDISEIDGIWIVAATAAEARELAKPAFETRGYSKERGESLGQPYRMDKY